jgi:hypothetical protein
MGKRRIPFILAHAVAIVTSITTICASLFLIGYFILNGAEAEERLSGHRPTYFRGQLTDDLLDDYGSAFVVGHNSGATLKTTRQAIANGADVIEIDVASMNGTLVSAHVPPSTLYGPQVFRGPTLAAVWRAAADASVIQLDLKESTPHFRALLFDFLDEHAGEHTVMIATPDVAMLQLLSKRAPAVLRFLSVPDRATLERLYEDPELIGLVDGVTTRYQLVDEESVSLLKGYGLIVLAWTVNDMSRVNEFVALGVDGVSTDNLAIMGLLGGRQSGERLATLRSESTEHQSAFEESDEAAVESVG